ncbi:alpha-lytic protease prodomain-containing protein [Actinokineospora fastidiosa]|uniref:Serine protease n=1 Tax=Actinokineospora fastidiosa TaxID=1816 RepID=A0A918GKY6_9PSEU|nr:alpha-lytic protease prodomain-containing protein [Actinokineospora fastidiosa]GGS42120.1 serine protease [Actinokineospora fastidiosa]
MNRKIIAAATAAITAAGLATAIALTPTATAGQTAPTVEDTQSAILAAMSRDLRISPEQAKRRLATEEAAATTDATLKTLLGSGYAGSWMDATGSTLTVAVTDGKHAEKVRALGAVPKTVARSAAQLDAAKAKLDAKATSAPKTVPGWYVDVTTNEVVVLSHKGGEAAAKAWAAKAGLSAARIRTSAENPRPFIDVIGGNSYSFGGSRCSVGFSVQGGFVTAGHCGGTGTRTSNPSGVVAGSSFPGNDYGWVRVDAGNTPRPLVNRYPGTVPVAGSQEAPVGAAVCRSGATTGWRCGTIQQKNATVNYPQGSVSGLTRTSACAQPGDSGGSWLAGDQAQGVTSGGSGNCTSGGTFYFQPLLEILSVYNLRLLTSGDNNPPTTTTTTTSGDNNPPGGTWAPYTSYSIGSQVTYGGASYRALQAHTSLPGWEPPNVPALWQRV